MGTDPRVDLPRKRRLAMLASLCRAVLGRRRVETFPALSVASLPAVQGRLEIVRDRRGVVHVYAEHETSLCAALGFMQAADRFFQFDVLRHVGAGRLCELVGDLPAPRDDEIFAGKRIGDLDAFVAPLDLARKSAGDLARMSPHGRACIESFAEGVGAALRAMRGVYPGEYLLLGRVRVWEPADCLLAARTSALAVSMVNFDTELTFDAVRSAVGDELARKIYPGAPWEAAPTSYEARGSAPPQAPVHVPAGGSNSWAVAADRSASGAPLLANDPHVPLLPLPTYWYHVHVETPSLRAQGGMFPGCPVLGFGHNGYLAWSVTTGYRDSWDFYRIHRSPGDPMTYAALDGLAPITRHEQPHRSRLRRPRTLAWESCEHGVLLPGWKHHDGVDLSIRLVESDAGEWFEGHLDLLCSRSVDEHRRALARIHRGPFDFNHVYAHRDGFVGWEIYGVVPRRRGDGLFVRDADDPAAQWDGVLGFEEMPKILEPQGGAVGSANSITDPGNFHQIATAVHFEARYRQERIESLLGAEPLHSVATFEAMQRDVEAVHVREACAGLVALARRSEARAEPAAAAALEILAGWDGRCDVESRGVTVFFFARKELARLCFEPLLGAQVARRFLAGRRVLPRIHDLLADEHDSLRACVEIAGHRSLADLAVEALAHAATRAATCAGADSRRWKWGNVQRVRLGAVLAELPILRRRLRALDAAFPGEEYTLSPARSIDEPSGLRVLVGASSRFICDLARPEEAWFAHSGGASGDPGSFFHADACGPWSRFEMFRSCLWKPEDVPDVVERVVVNRRA